LPIVITRECAVALEYVFFGTTQPDTNIIITPKLNF